jgi:hypothetical protein
MYELHMALSCFQRERAICPNSHLHSETLREIRFSVEAVACGNCLGRRRLGQHGVNNVKETLNLRLLFGRLLQSAHLVSTVLGAFADRNKGHRNPGSKPNRILDIPTEL